jgi:thiamine-phosphate pyrophosphorylase
MRTPRDWSLYLVTDRGLACGRSLETVVEAAVRGGVTAVQIREKACSAREFIELGCALKALLDPLGIPLIVNDRVDIALAIGASGVHVGQTDIDCRTARRLVGPEAIVGLSIETVEQAREAAEFDIDYLGVGPVFATPTKTDAAPALGFDGLARVRALSKLPIVAIGGMNAANAGQAIEAGADGIAVVSAICAAADPESAARELRSAVDQARRAGHR